MLGPMITFYADAEVSTVRGTLAALDLNVSIEDAEGIFDGYPTAIDIYTTRTVAEVTALVLPLLGAAGIDAALDDELERRALKVDAAVA